MKKFILTLFAVFLASVAINVPVGATAVDTSCNQTFLTMPAWFNNISGNVNGKCTPLSPKDISSGDDAITQYITRIALNIIAIGTNLVAYLAFFFILYGGFQYLTSSGNPDQAAKARKTILNAIIGVVITISASAIVDRLSAITASTGTPEEVIGSILNIVYFLAGTIAVLVIVISGYKFVTGGGNPDAIQKAKNTILYAVIGLIIVFLAYAITRYVLDQL